MRLAEAPAELNFASAEKSERESVLILSDDRPRRLSLWTAQPALAHKLVRDHPDALINIHRDTDGKITGLSFDLPIECFKLRRGKRKLSDRQRSVLESARTASTGVTLPPKTLRAQHFEALGVAKQETMPPGPSPRLTVEDVAVR